MAATRRGFGKHAHLRVATFGKPVAASTALAGKRATWLGGAETQPQFLAGTIGSMAILEAVVPPVRIEQRPARGGATRRPGRQAVLHLAGHGRYRAAGVTVEQQPGDVVVVAAEVPVEVIHPAGAHVIVLALPAAACGASSPPVQRLTGAAGRLVARQAMGLVEEASGLGAGLRAGCAQHLAGLVELALADAALEAGNSLVLRQRQVLAWLEAHLAVPDLTAEAAAAALGLSRRWLHELLRTSNTTFRRFLTRRRLETCRARLEDPALAHQSITTIALASGFNDLSTFYRQFRRHYRTTPRAIRGVALRAGDG